MTSMGGMPFSLEMRDTIQKLVREEIDRSRPRYRYATVITINRDTRRCGVVFNGETGVVQVNMGSIQPSAVNQVVRVEGIGVDKYITDIIGDSFGVARTGRIQPLYTSGKPYVTWDGETKLSGPYEIYSGYNPSQYDVVQGIYVPGRGYVLYPVQDFVTNMPYARWYSIPLSNGWNEYDATYGIPKYTKTSSGIVKLQGLIKGGSTTPASIIGTLPVGFRPAKAAMFAAEISSTAGGSVDVNSDGTIVVRNVLSAYTSLDQISFPSAEVAPNSAWTNVSTFSTGWINYDTGETPFYAPAGWWKDADGVVWQRGLARRIDNSNTPSIMFFMPAGLGVRTPNDQAMHRRSTAGNQFASVQAYPDGNTTYASGDSGAYVSLDGIPYYGDGLTPSWQNPSFQNGWVNYGGSWSTAQFCKTKSGHVMLKGLIKSGIMGGQPFFQLPIGYRPRRRLLMGGVANGIRCRIDVDTDGLVLGMDQVSNAWTSIDSINFVAEQ